MGRLPPKLAGLSCRWRHREGRCSGALSCTVAGVAATSCCVPLSCQGQQLGSCRDRGCLVDVLQYWCWPFFAAAAAQAWGSGACNRSVALPATVQKHRAYNAHTRTHTQQRAFTVKAQEALAHTATGATQDNHSRHDWSVCEQCVTHPSTPQSLRRQTHPMQAKQGDAGHTTLAACS